MGGKCHIASHRAAGCCSTRLGDQHTWHPLPDMAYLMMPWYTPSGLQVGTALGSLQGVPSENDYMRTYCRRRGIVPINADEWAFWKALTIFRLAAIAHGVYARGLAGNAGSTKALQSGASVTPLVERALNMLETLPSML